MFVRYYTDLPYPAAAVERALLLDGLRGWMPGVIADWAGQEERLLIDVGFAVAGQRLEGRGEVSVGEPTRLGPNLVVPLAWTAERAELPPYVEADLEVSGLGPNRTQVALSARYEPPLGMLGSMLDRALMHRVAEAVVKDTTERIVAVIRLRLAADTVDAPAI